MKKQFILILLTCFSLIASSLVAQEKHPVKWNYSVNYLSSNQAELLFTATIQEGWHLYSQHQNGMALPLVFAFIPDKSYEPLLKGKYLSEPKYTEIYNKEFADTERYLVGQPVFRYKIGIRSANNFEIRGKIEGQACIDGSCIPIRENFMFKVKGAASATEKTDTSIVAVVQRQAATDTPIVATTYSFEPLQPPSPEPISTEEESLWWFFVLAFAGGLLGILTPCVFPMIPMTVSYFLKHEGRRQALFYGFSIIFIYVVMGVLLSALFGQGFANFISTHWLPNLLFAGIFILFAISLFGYFELNMPTWLVNKSSVNETRSGYFGTFFMALTLVLVSFSCTLPIAGTVALSAAGGSFIKPIVGMLGFSLAFALPFTLFAFFPKMLKSLPKSGGWMNTIKVCLAFIELAFALKFINVPDQTYHWGILDREIYLAIWIVIFTLLGFYLLGKLRFPLDNEQSVQRSWGKLFAAITTFSFVVYMIPGLFGAPLNGLSGWLPPMQTQDFVLGGSTSSSSVQAFQPSASDEIPLFQDRLKAPAGLFGYFDYDQALRVAKKTGKPIFLDFTGHGCVNCRKIEQKVLANQRIRTLLSQEFVVCVLYVDDKVVELPPDLRIKDNKGTEITMLGEKNMHLQSSLFRQNSQPCYLVLNPDGEVLSGPIFFETNVDSYEAFLRKGMEAHQQ